MFNTTEEHNNNNNLNSNNNLNANNNNNSNKSLQKIDECNTLQNENDSSQNNLASHLIQGSFNSGSKGGVGVRTSHSKKPSILKGGNQSSNKYDSVESSNQKSQYDD